MEVVLKNNGITSSSNRMKNRINNERAKIAKREKENIFSMNYG